VEQQVDIPQLFISFDRDRMSRYGARAGELAEVIEAVFAGAKVSQVLDGQRTYDLVVRYRDDQRADPEAIGNTLIDTPVGVKVPLEMLASIREDVGPNMISRENVQRKIVIMANLGDRDLRSVVDDIRHGIEREVTCRKATMVYGQFESEWRDGTIPYWGGCDRRNIPALVSRVARRTALLIMVNLPLALIGGVVAVYLGGGVLSVASLVGFITLFGIATRNGIMMVSHYEHLRRTEGVPFDEAVVRGSMERLSPILMTALCAGLALIPLVLAGDRPGNEIQAPMGVDPRRAPVVDRPQHAGGAGALPAVRCCPARRGSLIA
jgi:Cu/Ag efflux pump CusA